MKVSPVVIAGGGLAGAAAAALLARAGLVVTVLEGSASGGGHAFSLSGAVVSAVAAKMERGKSGQWDYDKGAT